MQNLSLVLVPVLAAQKAAGDGLIKPLGHHELLLVLVQLSLLLLVARGLGEVMRRINLPPVVGELLAGVVLGPSLFGLLFPDLQTQIFPKNQEQSDLLSVISWLGVLFLLIVTGLETDLKLILRKGKTALLISLGGIIIPFITGFGLGWLLPNSFLADPAKRLVFSLFIATAMSISAVPVIAKVLMDLNLIRRDIGQVTLAAGMTDDTIGWILLSVVSGLASSGKFDFGTVFHSVSAAILFLAIAFTIGRTIVDQILRWVDDYVGGITASMSVVLILSLSAAALTHELGLEAALGAFVLGILAGQSRRFSNEAGHLLEVFTASFLAPIFFATAGLKVNLLTLLVPQTLIFGLIVLAVACFGKFTGAYLGSRVGGLSHWEGLAMGSGMNARGAMEIVVATIGLSLGVLNPQMYSIIVMVAIVTSLLAPPLLRWSLSKVVMGEEEARRLEQEQQDSRSFIKQIQRVLIPTSGGPNIQLAAQLVGHMAHQNSIEVTALYALSDKQPQSKVRRTATQVKDTAAEQALTSVTEEMQLPTDTTLQTKTESGRSKVEVIVNEANKNYDLIVLGASEQTRGQKALFNLLVDRVVQEAPCATMVVKSHLPQAKGETSKIPQQQLNKILVPTVGTEYSKNAVEMASTIAAQTGALVMLVNVINLPQVEYILYEQRSLAPVKEIAHDLLEQQAAIGRNLNADVKTYVLQGTSPEREILKFAQTQEVNLIILGSNIRMVTGRVFFGHRVDAILSKAHCPVAVITTAAQSLY
ncbi:cation:proton antiporter [Halotia branconii]|uniref:Cation:proton antiporter n=1 Tax=Halotia branconii CENA392 TaxID=1539056 RepID=A0AAJ6NUT2_9CYAN|nr:cation:proton antiporter [Halotia branconii]WGV27022.1 cation:proton antiporter [Halotia branconii CENA392]